MNSLLESLQALNPDAAFNYPFGSGLDSRKQATAGMGGAAFQRAGTVHQLFPNFKKNKSKRLSSRESWERADAYRPGKPKWFRQDRKDLVSLHKTLVPEIEALEEKLPAGIPGTGNKTSLFSTLLKSLTTGDLALLLCTKEPPVLKEHRDWLVETFPMPVAIRGLPEEQGRVLSTIAAALDARKILDLGTFTGYSSISIALSTADDARIICSEPDSEYAAHARLHWWEKANCSSKMEMHEIEAQEMMKEMIKNGEAGTVDMIFCDVSERQLYPEIHELAMQLLHVGGVIVYYDTLWPADSVLDHSYYPAMREFNMKLAQDPRVLASLVPLSYGITICTKVMGVDSSGLQAARKAADGGDRSALKELLLERRRAVQAELDTMPASNWRGS